MLCPLCDRKFPVRDLYLYFNHREKAITERKDRDNKISIASNGGVLLANDHADDRGLGDAGGMERVISVKGIMNCWKPLSL
jgi:hypothetical protein